MALEKSEEKDEPVKEVKADKAESQEEMIPMSKVQELVDQSVADAVKGGGSSELIKALTEAITNSKNSGVTQDKYDELSYAQPADIGPEDMLEDPVTFWATGVLLVIGDDKKNRVNIPAPYGVVTFKPQGEKRVQRGKETDIQILSTYNSYSKKESEFLQNHTMFGSAFFMKSDHALSVDTRYTAKIASYAQALRNTEAYNIIQQAKAKGLQVTDDVDGMRLQLATIQAKKDMEAYTQAELVTLKENDKDALLAGKVEK
jgi:hypothetical protein